MESEKRKAPDRTSNVWITSPMKPNVANSMTDCVMTGSSFGSTRCSTNSTAHSNDWPKKRITNCSIIAQVAGYDSTSLSATSVDCTCDMSVCANAGSICMLRCVGFGLILLVLTLRNFVNARRWDANAPAGIALADGRASPAGENTKA